MNKQVMILTTTTSLVQEPCSTCCALCVRATLQQKSHAFITLKETQDTKTPTATKESRKHHRLPERKSLSGLRTATNKRILIHPACLIKEHLVAKDTNNTRTPTTSKRTFNYITACWNVAHTDNYLNALN
jgi:hypothetical protein